MFQWVRSRQVRRGQPGRPLAIVAVVAAALLVAVVLIGWLAPVNQTTLWTEGAKLAMAAFGAAVVGGLVKYLFDEHARVQTQLERDKERERAAWQAKEVLIRALIAEVGDIRSAVAGARLLIAAHRSAKSYRDRMQEIIGARVRAQALGHTAEARQEEEIADTRLSDALRCIRTYVTGLDAYLGGLVREYREHYKPVADLQRMDEIVVDAVLERYGQEVATSRDGGCPRPPLPKLSWRAWQEIANSGRFSLLMDFIQDAPESKGPYDQLEKLSHDAMSALYVALRRVA
jgi:hypothetical protein